MANISEKIREARLRWLGHVERKTGDVVMRTWKMEVGGHRNIGRPKLRWSDVIRKYMKGKGVQRETQDWRRCRLKKNMCKYPPQISHCNVSYVLMCHLGSTKCLMFCHAIKRVFLRNSAHQMFTVYCHLLSFLYFHTIIL